MALTGKLTTVALTGLRNQMRLTNRSVYALCKTFPSSQINENISRFHNTASLLKFEIQPKSNKYSTPILSRSSVNLDLSIGISGSLEGIARGYSTDSDDSNQVKVCLDGLPYQSTEQEIDMWLSEAAVPTKVIIELNNAGRSTGMAYAYFKTQEEAQNVVAKMNKKYLGKRYINVSSAIDDEKIKDAFQVNLRGLPYESTEQEINLWLSEADAPILVAIKLNNAGRPSGMASAYFKTQDEAQNVVNKMHKKYLGKRYIEVYMSNLGGW